MMNNRTGTQVVLVTGAGSGIGYAIATVLARAGHTVYASLRLTQPEGAKRARTIRSLAAAAKLALQIVDLDVLSEASCRAAVDQILIEPGRIGQEARRVGKEGVSTCRYRWEPYQSKKKDTQLT